MRALHTPDEHLLNLSAIRSLRIMSRSMHCTCITLTRGSAVRIRYTIRNAGHFLQEDKGPELARVSIDFVANSG